MTISSKVLALYELEDGLFAKRQARHDRRRYRRAALGSLAMRALSAVYAYREPGTYAPNGALPHIALPQLIVIVAWPRSTFAALSVRMKAVR